MRVSLLCVREDKIEGMDFHENNIYKADIDECGISFKLKSGNSYTCRYKIDSFRDTFVIVGNFKAPIEFSPTSLVIMDMNGNTMIEAKDNFKVTMRNGTEDV